MFTITPIGSCRITTPLRTGQSVYGFGLNMDRCYGYCHSPAEAVQMVRFMQGSVDLPQDVWPLVSRTHDLKTTAVKPHAPSNLYVVELASAKEVTVDGVSIQLNYLNATYPDFFSDKDRAQTFWDLATSGDEEEISGFLAKHWSDTPIQQAEAETLCKLRLRHVTRESLRGDIKTLTELLPDVLFVSHVDACKADGLPIKSRSAFIKIVSEEAKAAGCRFYNPTDLMKDFGQSAAIEDESTGLAHFTEAFGRGIMRDWMRDVIAPMTDKAVQIDRSDAVIEKLTPQINALCESGNFIHALTRLNALPSDLANVAALLDQVTTHHDNARDAFERSAPAPLSDDSRIKQIQSASGLGLFERALYLIQNAPAGGKVPDHVLLQTGDLAKHVGAFDTAHAIFQEATLRGLPRAYAELADLAIAQNTDVLAKMDNDQRSVFLSCLPAVKRIQILTLNDVDFAVAVTPETSSEDVQAMMSHVAETHGIAEAATILSAWRMQQGTDQIADRRLSSMVENFVSAAQGLAQRSDRISALNALLSAAPRHKAARIAMQDLRKDLALLIRTAGKDQDITFLDALSIETSVLDKPLPELDLWRARLRFKLGDYAATLELGQTAVASFPESISVWTLLMRAATKGQYAADAVKFAKQVAALACPKTEYLKAEADAILQSDMVAV